MSTHSSTSLIGHSLGLVLHVNQGNSDPFPTFQQGASDSHWQVMTDGNLIQYLDSDLDSWAQVDGNNSYHSVETEGFTTSPLSPQQVVTLTNLYAWGHAQYGWPLQVAEVVGDAGFGWHGMGGVAWGNHEGCPGDLRKAQRTGILAALTAPSVPAPPTFAPAPAGPPVVLQTFTDKNLGAMQTVLVPISLDAQGNGYVPTTYPWAKFIAVTHQGPDPDPTVDSTYWVGSAHAQDRGNNVLVSVTGVNTREGEAATPRVQAMNKTAVYLTLAQ